MFIKNLNCRFRNNSKKRFSEKLETFPRMVIILLILSEFLMGSSLNSLKIGNENIPFIFEESRQLPIVSMQLVFEVAGSISDENLSGVANLAASLLNEGSSISDEDKFADILDESAIHLSADIGVETLVVRLDSLKENFSKGIEILVEVLNYPNSKKSTFERVKNRIKSRILQKGSNFDYLGSLGLKELLFKDTPLGNPKDGKIEDIDKIKVSHVEKFFEERITLSNVIPVIGGDLSKEEAIQYLEKVLATLEIGERRELPKYNVSIKENFKKIVKDTKQAYIYFGSPLNAKYEDNDLYKLKVMSFILGASGFGSRLMEEIRVKGGLAYSVYANAQVDKSRSFFSGHLQTKTENLESAKSLVKNIISKFIENGITEDELQSAKRFLLGSEPLRNETLSQRVDRAFHEYYRNKPLGYGKVELEAIKNLELTDLNSFIKNHGEILNLSFSIVTAE
jgi:predicted Zn-dependent peptidase